MLSAEVIPLCGLDVTNVRKQEVWEKDISGVWEKWEKKMMGLIDSSYNKCRAVIFNRRVALGDMLILKNNFGW